MAKKDKEIERRQDDVMDDSIFIAGAGIMREDAITDTLKDNYMPYAMSVIVSRAIPEIDGFKPSHRKLLYTMYLMGLLNGARTKSANVVGQTMKLNPHGDQAIYETMVRMARGNETLLHPYVDSKGNFGKAYSRDMAYAASRYTEVKLAKIAAEMFSDIGKECVDFVPNYDNSMQEPVLLPATFPSILVNSNLGIAVGMSSNICSFNLAEVCETTVELLKDPDHDISLTLRGPDFSGGGILLRDQAAFDEIYNTGKGSVRVRAKYEYVKAGNRIEITEIPATTSVEAIQDKILEHVKNRKITEISDLRDETDKNGLKLTIDLKRGVDPDAFMVKMFKLTPLEDTFSCNFTVLIDGAPKLLGARQILLEWIRFRRNCVVRRTKYELGVKEDRLHLLEGLEKILLDIDKAIRIVRETEEEKDVVPNLMIGFGIDEVQANYVAEIKLRHLNREYILSRTAEIDELREEIDKLKRILAEPKLVDKIIMREQADVANKYAQPRKTVLVDTFEEYSSESEQGEVDDSPMNIFYTASGYFKKITPQSLRMASKQKVKEGDKIVYSAECTNSTNLLFFTNKQNAYKLRVSDFEETKASSMGEFVTSKLELTDGELVTAMIATKDFKGNGVFCYSNGKVARVPLVAYDTKLNRKKLTSACSDKAELVWAVSEQTPSDYVMFSTNGRAIVFNSALVPEKQTKSTNGVQVLSVRNGQQVNDAGYPTILNSDALHRYRARKIPAAGGILKEEDLAPQDAEDS